MMPQKKKSNIIQLALFFVLLLLTVACIGFIYTQRSTALISETAPVEEPAVIDLRDQDITVQEYLEQCELHPSSVILWRVPVNGMRYDTDLQKLEVLSGNSFDSYVQVLRFFPQLNTIDLRESGYSAEEIRSIMESYPEYSVDYVLWIGDQSYSPDTSVIALDTSKDTIVSWVEVSDLLPQVDRILLGDKPADPVEVLSLHDAYPSAQFEGSFDICGKIVDAETAELDLIGVSMPDTTEIEAAARCMQNLVFVDMSDCGIPDEDMDILNKKFSGIEFVWTIYFNGKYPFRTDADNFCISKFNATSYPGMTDEVLAPLKYFTKMVTLDLGHMELTNLSFCEYMPHLKYLIIGDNPITDLSGLRNCSELYYVEAFLTPLTDVSPLMELTSLRHLNLCFTRFQDYTQLLSMTFLERLWIKSTNLSNAQIQEINAALPNTWVVSAGEHSSVDYQWRHHDSYFEMRDNLGMPYAIAK